MSDRTPTSIEEVPGFGLLKEYLDQRFGRLDDRIKTVASDTHELKASVDGLVECVSTGNGQPALKTQVGENTDFRLSFKAEKQRIRSQRRTAFYSFVVSALLLGISIGLACARTIPAGGG